MNKNNLDECDISPVRPNDKYHVTPLRRKRTASRRDQGIDAHTASCSTPNNQSPVVSSNRSLNSPSSSFPYSQENCPDVVWDFTSPKVPRGSRKKDLKLTIGELLDNLNQCQSPENNGKSSQYIHLLENWMSKQNSNATIKKTEKKRKETKRSKQVFEELQQFLDSIPKPNTSEPNINNRSDSKQVAENEKNSSRLNISAKSFLEGESTDDSTEELWGESDSSFIIRATQELEATIPASAVVNNRITEDVISTIPDTESSSSAHSTVQVINCDTQLASTAEKCKKVFEQLVSIDWDFDLDYDDWEDDCIEDTALSSIPDDVLAGSVDVESHLNGNRIDSGRGLTMIVDQGKESSNNKGVSHLPKSNCTDLLKSEELVNAELYNSFEDESFEDESLLCQPDVLSKIEEVEYMLTQPPQCTPEEIKKKKDEAIKRLKKKSIL